jgi:hypothetical protein
MGLQFLVAEKCRSWQTRCFWCLTTHSNIWGKSSCFLTEYPIAIALLLLDSKATNLVFPYLWLWAVTRCLLQGCQRCVWVPSLDVVVVGLVKSVVIACFLQKKRIVYFLFGKFMFRRRYVKAWLQVATYLFFQIWLSNSCILLWSWNL